MFDKNANPAYRKRALAILIIGFITMYFSGCFGTDIINVIQSPIMEKLGCTATQASLGWSIGGYSVIVLAFIFSTIIIQKGVRGFSTLSFFIMAVGAVLVGVGYTMNSVAVITIGGFLLKNFLQALQISVFQVVARWFNKSRGMALGIMGASFALDNSTSSTGLTLILNALGFNGMMIVAAVILVVLGILTFALVRTTPEEIGLTVDGLEAAAEETHEENHGPMKSKWTFGKLFAKKESWCIMLGIGIFNMTLQAVITQFFGSLLGMGVPQTLCMTYMVVFGLLGVVMSPIYGKLVDKLGAPKTGVIAAILYIVSIAGFAFHIPLVAATGLTFFVGSPILQPALTMHVFGGREYQAANRYITVGANIIAACGIPFMTIFYDMTSSYTTAYYTLLVLNIVVLLLMLLCRNTYVED
jgi:predicted MFS family arabinose efflux permease